jgi:hypothetical protein
MNKIFVFVKENRFAVRNSKKSSDQLLVCGIGELLRT